MCVFLHVGTHHTVGRICVWSNTMESSLLHPGGDTTAAVGRGILELEWPSDDINPEWDPHGRGETKRLKRICGSPDGGASEEAGDWG